MKLKSGEREETAAMLCPITTNRMEIPFNISTNESRFEFGSDINTSFKQMSADKQQYLIYLSDYKWNFG